MTADDRTVSFEPERFETIKVEIADHVLVMLRSSATFVLPKQQINDAQLRELLRVLREATELPVQQRLDWKWR